MKERKENIKRFFRQYEDGLAEALAGNANTEAIAGAFANCFVEANPFGVTCGKNDEEFHHAIPKGFEFYRSIGTKNMKIVSVHTTVLDDFHCMSTVHWEAFFETKDGPKVDIQFEVIYFLQSINEQLKIFAYITGDEQGELRKRGLVES